MDLVLPLPTVAAGKAPTHLSYRFCETVHREFQKLRQHKLFDGGDALIVWVASSPEHVARWDESFGPNQPRWGPEIGSPTFVSLVLLMSAKNLMVSAVWLGLTDFQNGGGRAREKLSVILQHLQEHALPQISPEWMSSALDALEGKTPSLSIEG